MRESLTSEYAEENREIKTLSKTIAVTTFQLNMISHCIDVDFYAQLTDKRAEVLLGYEI